ncbi:MAG TPA: laccase domain-containing protein, partial [Casimicrobiaceae bacterium]|nr:laccase domain-containing protein [Casimicrobiaceae bacterium]
GGMCTLSDPLRWFSYRRDRTTGRMAALIWIDPAADGSVDTRPGTP